MVVNNLINGVFFEKIIGSLNIPVLIVDDQFRIIYANHSLHQTFKTIEKDCVNTSLIKTFKDFFKREKLKTVLSALNKKRLNSLTLKTKSDNKSFLLSGNIVQKSVKPMFWITFFDVSKFLDHTRVEEKSIFEYLAKHEKEKQTLENRLKRRVKQIEDKNTELERANKELESFNYIASHDLQEPLRKIQSFCNLLISEEQANLSKDAKSYIERINQTGFHMQKLIEDLLSYSRLKSKEIKFESVELRKLVVDALDHFPDINSKKVILKKPAKNCRMTVIQFQFLQLLRNLISNSIKFRRADVKLKISISGSLVKPSRILKANVNPELKYWHIIYADNGIGFAQEYAQQIFEVFKRLHTNSQYTGTGIGLSICKRVVDNHQGFIRASGKPMKGARFDIFIPSQQNINER